MYSSVIVDIVAKIKEIAGSKIEEASLATVLSKAQHDADNKGLKVTSQRDEQGNKGPENWTAKGDGYVVDNTKITDQKTFDMTVAAMKVSRAELEKAAELGTQHKSTGEDLTYGRGDTPEAIAKIIGLNAQEFIPREAAGNPDMEPSEEGEGWGANMAQAIDDTFNNEILPMIKDLIPENKIEKIEGRKIHVGRAMKAVAEVIRNAPPHVWLSQALQEVVEPAYEGTPVPAGVPPGGPIVDAGVPAE